MVQLRVIYFLIGDYICSSVHMIH